MIKNNNSFGVVTHTFEPIYDKNSRILILGTMPSVKSREANFYYMNPQNIFWRILSNILKTPYPQAIDDKKEMLINNRIAVWDVLKSCEIEGSLDSTIKKAVPNDFSNIFSTSDITAIFTTGTKATSLFKSHCRTATGMESIYLPSTSPANKKYYSYDKILEEWKKILLYIKERGAIKWMLEKLELVQN